MNKMAKGSNHRFAPVDITVLDISRDFANLTGACDLNRRAMTLRQRIRNPIARSIWKEGVVSACQVKIPPVRKWMRSRVECPDEIRAQVQHFGDDRAGIK